MEKRILFISEQHNFLVMAMIKNLEAANFEVVTSQPDIVEIQLKNKLPDISCLRHYIIHTWSQSFPLEKSQR